MCWDSDTLVVDAVFSLGHLKVAASNIILGNETISLQGPDLKIYIKNKKNKKSASYIHEVSVDVIVVEHEV